MSHFKPNKISTFKRLSEIHIFASKLNKGIFPMNIIYSGIPYFRSLEYPFLASLFDKRKRRILDIGSADGLFPFFLAYKGHEVYATDLSTESMIETSDNLKLGTKKRIHIEKQDATKLSYRNNFFDSVTAVSTLEHLESEKDTKAIKELSRILKEGGEIILTLPFGKKLIEERYDGVFQRRYNSGAIKKRIINPSGLKIKDIFYYNQRIPFNKLFYRLSVNWRHRISILQMISSLVSLTVTKKEENAVGICLIMKK